MGIMTNNRIRHLPIIDGEHLEGLISIGDVVKAQLEETEFENRYLKDYIERQ
jgi:CBS domain-containing protein